MFKLFSIKKGKHSSSGFNFGFTFTRKIVFKAVLSESCLYEFNDVDKHDVNKLCGFSSTYNHMKQSARIGWRCVDGKKFEILTYPHENGKISFEDIKVIGEVLPNQPFVCSIGETPYYKNEKTAWYVYTFRLGDSGGLSFTKSEKRKSIFPFQYYLFPYFGGNKTAPHDMSIQLEIV